MVKFLGTESFYSVILIYFGILWTSCDGRTSESLRVTLPNGSKLLGRYKHSHDGHGILAFMGIPYAEPPLGPLRFKPPQPKAPWTKELEVTKYGAICTQRNTFFRLTEVEGEENCLFLNVFTPSNTAKKNLPVMVFFHGGGFMCGESDMYGPDYLLNHDIVLVTANYRLGTLGFLSTGQEDCPGNNGLKDQVEVLRWVNQNIAVFNGDSKRVTIFGESAGGASVTYHMMSPLSKGLFARAIAESGTNVDSWAQPTHGNIAVERATELAKKYNCFKGDKWAEALNCLRKIPAQLLTNSFYDFFKWDFDPMVPFPPVVEPDLPGAFISKHPIDVADPHGLTIPFMTGINTDEGTMKSAPIINIPELRKDFTENVEKALPIILYYDHHAPQVQENITKEIQKLYFQNEPFGPKYDHALGDVIGDGWFIYGMYRYLQLRFSQKNAGPTYIYLFNHKGAASATELFAGGRENYYGISHAEELFYLFPFTLLDVYTNSVPTEGDREIRKAITALWVNFASEGNPTPDGAPNLPKWEPTTKYPLDYYVIGAEGKLLEMQKGLNQFDKRMDMWTRLKPHDAKRDTL